MKAASGIPDADFSPEGGNVIREITVFYSVSLAITVALTVLLWKLPADFRTGDVQAIRRAVNDVGAFIIFVPVLTALVATLVFRGWRGLLALIRRIVTFRFSPAWYAVALLIPPIPQWLGAILWARFTGADLVFPDPVTLLSFWAQATVFGAVILLGEEIGWSGFMLPRLLTRFGWRTAALIGGILWAVWHLPFWAPANYAATGSVAETATILAAASAGAISLSVVITWLFVRSRYSIALAALLHGSNNASMGKVYDMLGDGAGADPSWAVCYNLLLVAVAAVFLVLPDKRPAK